MYMRDHAVVGAGIGLLTYTVLPVYSTSLAVTIAPFAFLMVIILGILSHFLLDFLNEAYMEKMVWVEGGFMALLAAMVYFMMPVAAWPLVITGVISANIPDIWDSRFYLTYVNRKKWPHLGHWPCHQKGFPIVELTPWQTIAFSIVAYSILLLLIV